MKIARRAELMSILFVLYSMNQNLEAQTCSGSWSTTNSYTYQCITGNWIGSSNPGSEPSGCPANPVYTSGQKSTFTFSNPVSTFSFMFNAFSGMTNCARIEVLINDVHYNLTAANLSAIGGICVGITPLIDTNGYIITYASSTVSSNNQGQITISGINATSVTIATNDGAGSIFSYPSACLLALPVKLDYFTGNVSECEAMLAWKSAAEIDFDSYVVEYSEDGITFNAVKKLASAGDNSLYNITHQPSPGKAYYRLKMIDKDGSVSYSNTIVLNIICDNDVPVIYPNPVCGILNVKVNNGDAVIRKKVAVLYDMTGRKMLNQMLISGNNQLDVTRLPAGIYNLHIDGVEKASIYKIMIKN